MQIRQVAVLETVSRTSFGRRHGFPDRLIYAHAFLSAHVMETVETDVEAAFHQMRAVAQQLDDVSHFLD